MTEETKNHELPPVLEISFEASLPKIMVLPPKEATND